MNKKPTPDTLVFQLGDIVRRVYYKDEAGMVTGITYRLNSSIEYIVSWPEETEEHRHYAEELRRDDEYVEKAN